ncbi:Activity-regulated cytoskeleton-associated protein, partial [Aphis craccivora]
MCSVAKTIFQMSIAELKSECELRDIISTGAKSDILIRLEQCILNDGINNCRTGVPDYSVVESGDGYIDDEVRNICFNNDQLDRLSVAANDYGSNNTIVDLGHQVSNAAAHVRREVELFSIENRLESIKTALVDIKNSVRSLNARQDAIENRLKSHSYCGAIGNTRHSSNRDFSNLAELNTSHYSDRRSTQFYEMPNSDSVNTVFPNSQTHYPERCTGQPETLASTRNPAFSFNFKLTPPQFAGKKYEDPKNCIQNYESVFHNSGVPPSEWVRLIPDQLIESTSTWYKMVKSTSLTWDDFVIEFADRWDSPVIRSQLMAELMSVRQPPEQSLTDFCIYKYNLARRIELQFPETDIVEIV